MKMKKLYMKPETKYVWYGLNKDVMENVGGMGATSGRTYGNTESWVKGEKDLGEQESGTTLSTGKSLWDEEW